LLPGLASPPPSPNAAHPESNDVAASSPAANSVFLFMDVP
jgi:hypothetical protein